MPDKFSLGPYIHDIMFKFLLHPILQTHIKTWYTTHPDSSNQLYRFLIRLKKNKSYVSKLPRAFVFRCAFDSAKSKVWNFFACLIFFFQFFMNFRVKIYKKRYEKHFEQQTSSTLCSVLYILLIQKSSSIFQSCGRLRSDTSAAQGGGKKKKRLKKRV